MNKIVGLLLIGAMLIVVAPASGLGYLRELCQKGASYPVAASNDAGEVLVTWEETKGVSEGSCEQATAQASIESPKGGVTNLGTVPTRGNLSFPIGAYIDGAGEAWIAGLHGEIGYSKYGPSYGKAGAWLSFRPISGRFESSVELPSRHGRVETVLLAGNQNGQALLAWGVWHGTYLAWVKGDKLLRTTYVGSNFHVAGMGVDGDGRALVIGYYPGRYLDTASAISAIAAEGLDHFSRPHVIARPLRHSPRKGFTGSLDLPVVGVGQHGQAVIAYEADWESRSTPEEFKGPDMMIYRRADGRLTQPRAFAKAFLDFPNGAASFPGSDEAPEPPSVVVDGAGRAVIISSGKRGVEEIFVASSGRVARRAHLSEASPDEIALAGNADGQTIGAWTAGLDNLTLVLGDTHGHHGKPMIVKPPNEIFGGGGPVAAIDDGGRATVVWVEGTLSGNNVVNTRTVVPGAPTIPVGGPVSR